METQNTSNEEFFLNDRELDLLEFVHDMKFATLNDLYKKYYYYIRNGFTAKSDWYARERIQRLMRNGFLKIGRTDERMQNFYIVTEKTLRRLERQYPAKFFGNHQRNIDVRCFEHDKLVLKTRLYMESEGACLKWISDKRLKCHPRILSTFGKDYLPDALILDKNKIRYAVEIEISRKGRAEYSKKISRYVSLVRGDAGFSKEERLVDKVLYICVKPKVYEALRAETELYQDIIEVIMEDDFFGIIREEEVAL